jgi:hypothetical protein
LSSLAAVVVVHIAAVEAVQVVFLASRHNL